MLSQFMPQEQRLLASEKIKISHFAEKKKKSLIKALKTEEPSTEPCGIPFKIFVQSLNVRPILVLYVHIVK